MRDIGLQALCELRSIGRCGTLYGGRVSELQHHGRMEGIVEEGQVLDPVQPEGQVTGVETTYTNTHYD